MLNYHRYLHQQWDKKASNKKRGGEAPTGPDAAAKKPRLESLLNNSNTVGVAAVVAGSVSSRTSLSYTVPGLQGPTTQPYYLPGPSGGSNPTYPPPAYPAFVQQPVNRFANQQ